jgi:hypothetical protein
MGKDGNLIPLCTHEWSKSKATAGLNWTKEKSHQGFLCMKLRFRVSGRIGIKTNSQISIRFEKVVCNHVDLLNVSVRAALIQLALTTQTESRKVDSNARDSGIESLIHNKRTNVKYDM